MPKEEMLNFCGNVVDKCPNATFRVALDNDMLVLCTLSGKMRKNNIFVAVGDKVDVEMSTYDYSKGRITFRHKAA